MASAGVSNYLEYDRGGGLIVREASPWGLVPHEMAHTSFS